MLENIMGQNVLDSSSDNYKIHLRIMRLRMLLYRITEKLHKEEYNLGVEQYLILYMCCSSEKPMNPGQFTKITFRKANTISNHLSNLQKKGLISMQLDPTKRSRTIITITEQGKKIIADSQKSDSPINNATNSFFDNMTADEKNQLAYLLQKVYDNVLEKFGSI